MSLFGWLLTIGGAVIVTTLFEIVCHWLFGVKQTKIHSSHNFAYQSRIRWWEKIWF